MRTYTRLKKVLLFLFLLSLFRLLNNCCSCDNTLIYFDIKKLYVSGLDNSGSYPVSNSDTLHHNAIAFEIWLSDSNSTQWACTPAKFGFEQALGCECDNSFKANQTIDSIQIINLGRFNENIEPGQIINEFCLAYPDPYFEPGELYITIPELLENINQQILSDSRIYKFQLFLTEKSIHRNATFSFKVFLSDGTMLSKNIQLALK